MKQLAGTMFVRNGIQYDYCFMEAIESLLNFCDAVYVVDAGSDDGTTELLSSITHINFFLIKRTKEEWDAQKGTGQKKLCYFTDIAIDAAEKNGYEYSFYCQADEVVHENSYENIRELCNFGAEGYMINRKNLWGSPYYELNVSPDRLPCGEHITRLAKTKYRSIGDAETIGVPYENTFISNGVNLYHMGFVRDRTVMKERSINMQENVFELGHHDHKLDVSDIFVPEMWFDPKKDIKLISVPLPKTIKAWAAKRVYKF